MNFLISFLKITFLLGFLILIHEGGHFLVAKLFKIKVNEFAIGFGPQILKKKKGETIYAVRLIPLGGFVNLEGEEKFSDVDGSFSKATILQKILIVIAGAGVNILFGIITYFILASLGKFSLNSVETSIESNFLNSLYCGFINTKFLIISVLNSLREMIAGGFSVDQMTGIVGISNIVTNSEGILEYIYLAALISLSLGITNLMPFPPLDGGKVLIYIIELIRKKPLKEETELKIQSLGFSILIVLSIFVTYNDIIRII